MITNLKEHRIKTLFFADVMDPEAPKKQVRAVVINMGLNGAEFECSKEQFKQGEKVELIFDLPKRNIFIIMGSIRRVRTHQNGSLFYDVQFKEQNFINRVKIRYLIKKIRNNRVASPTENLNSHIHKVNILCKARIRSPENPSESLQVEVIDLNLKGMIFKSKDKKFQQDKKIEVSLEDFKQKELLLSGKVKRVHQIYDNSFGHGVKFRHIGLLNKFNLFKYIHKLTK